MSRFRVIKSKGKFYVVTTDSNGLAGGPYDAPGEAEMRATRLASLEAKQAEMRAQPEAHKINITPGYRSPDVEDGRFDKPPITSAWAPDWWQRQPKMGDGMPRDEGQVPPWKKHRIPQEPFDPSTVPPMQPPEYNLRDLGTPGGAFDWTPRPPWLARKPGPKP